MGIRVRRRFILVERGMQRTCAAIQNPPPGIQPKGGEVFGMLELERDRWP